MHHPNVFKLPKNKNIIESIDDSVISTPVISQPLFTLGFHYFISRTRDGLTNILKKLETKNDFYNIVNPFELNILKYEDSINKLSKVYLKKEIESLDFYKIWEICFLFDIINKNSSYTCNCSNDNMFFAVKYYREKFMDKKTNNKSTEYSLIIKDEEINIKDLISILSSQEKNGSCIIKINDIMTLTIIKMVYMLSDLYEEIFIYKPFITRASESEKFLICKNFSDNKNLSKLIDNLKSISKTKNYINDIFLNLEISSNFLNAIKFLNIKLVNNEQIVINNIIKYIKENNYFGDKYHDYKSIQIENSKWWVSMFFPPSSNLFKENTETFHKLINNINDKFILEIEKFGKELII